MGMSHRFVVVVLACIALATALAPARAEQTPEMTAAYAVDTGHAFIDAALWDINHYVERHPDAFLDELEWFADAARRPMAAWLGKEGHQGADLYFGCQLAAVTERPCAEVMKEFDAAGPDGWKTVLDALEPRLSRAQWAQIESRIRASYGRWARPLPVVAGRRR